MCIRDRPFGNTAIVKTEDDYDSDDLHDDEFMQCCKIEQDVYKRQLQMKRMLQQLNGPCEN